MRLPPAYVGFTFRGGYGFAHASVLEPVRRSLGGGEELHGWATRQRGAERLAGRGVVCSIPAPAPGPDGTDRWAVRRYRRGGGVTFLGERYARRGEARPLIELRASVEARARGVPTPAVVAGALYPAGLFYRADIATELIPEGHSLADRLWGPGPPAGGAADALARAGRLTRALEDAGVLHADLNARNVLVGAGADPPAAHVVDLDRCRVLPLGAHPRRGPMRRRLERSLRKLGGRHGQPLTEPQWEALRAGFGAEGP